MPMYTQQCLKCGEIFDDFRPLSRYKDNPRCKISTCDNETKRLINGGAAHTWKPRWFEHIDVEPIFIETKEQLKKECKKRNVASVGYM